MTGLLLLYAALAVSASTAALIVYRNDLYDREPWPLLTLTTALGAAAIELAGWAESWVFTSLQVTTPAGLAAVAAFLEESGKLAVVGAIAVSYRHSYFNDPMDGLIYGSMAGLGMALDESVYYLWQSPQPDPFLAPVELVRICGHLVMGGIGGFAVGMARMGIAGWRRALGAGFLAAVALHFAWDYVVLGTGAPGLSERQATAGVGIMLAGLLVYGVLTTIGSGWSHALFDPSHPARLWGWPFDRIVARGKGG